jgi:CubicO group peptidase (beta-lactamase class C family)
MKHLLNLALLFSFVTASAQTPDTLRRIDELFTRWNNATPGGSVIVERNGKVIYHKAFGLADLEHNVPNTSTTIFEAGSVSKQFTAASILLLAQEGKLSLDDDVRKYIPELPVYGRVITIRNLMYHTSGLKDWGSVGALAGWPRTTRVYTLAIALDIICKQKSLNFLPGDEYSYSNSGYTLMVVIVERVSGKSLSEFTRTRLFEPAGMKNTRWRDNFREILPGRAVAYRRASGKYEQEMPFENVHGHGGLLTTTEDLILWNHQLSNPTIGGEAWLKNRTEVRKLTGGIENNYAAGLVVNRHNGFREINHTGATAGYRAVLSWYPERKIAIAILSNDGSFNPGGFGSQIADIFLGKTPVTPAPNRASVAVPEASLKRYEGVFSAIRTFDVIAITLKDGQLIYNDKPLTILHADTVLRDRSYWIMKKNGQLMTKSPVDTFTYNKVKGPDGSPAYLRSLIGTYRSDEADATYMVELRGAELWVVFKAGEGFKITPSHYDGFLVDGEDLFEFKRNKKGMVEGLLVSISRAERVPFRRVL